MNYCFPTFNLYDQAAYPTLYAGSIVELSDSTYSSLGSQAVITTTPSPVDRVIIRTCYPTGLSDNTPFGTYTWGAFRDAATPDPMSGTFTSDPIYTALNVCQRNIVDALITA